MVTTQYRTTLAEAVRFASGQLAAQADADRAAAMAAYMKTDMPFYGVQAPQRRVVERSIRKTLRPADVGEYEACVDAFWSLSRREEKYLAIGLAGAYREFLRAPSLPLYRRMIVEGAWWDLVDPTAAWCVGGALLADRSVVAPVMEEWVVDDHMWLRRSALLAHLGHKKHTDEDVLFAHCLALADEREFFIRKAIGWVLREYAKTNPGAVTRFVVEHRERLSGLSLREATKHLPQAR